MKTPRCRKHICQNQKTLLQASYDTIFRTASELTKFFNFCPPYLTLVRKNLFPNRVRTEVVVKISIPRSSVSISSSNPARFSIHQHPSPSSHAVKLINSINSPEKTPPLGIENLFNTNRGGCLVNIYKAPGFLDQRSRRHPETDSACVYPLRKIT